MRLTEWRAEAPAKEALTPRVLDVVGPVMQSLAGDPDPDCWVVWGDDPTVRYTVLAPTEAGLVACFVRLNVPGEGPRASAKLVRWSRVQVGELAVETQAGHRLLSFQVESSVLRGADEVADRIGTFAQQLFAAVDGRPWTAPAPPARARTSRRATSG